MADPIFCCASIEPYPRKIPTDHDNKFLPFIEAALSSAGAFERLSSLVEDNTSTEALAKHNSFAIQLVRQVNYGPLESKRYFTPATIVGTNNIRYIEVSETDLITANFIKANSYKNFKCKSHNRFFELNLYQKDPVNKHHWRANIARPAAEIDL
jgi:hypothetical protein